METNPPHLDMRMFARSTTIEHTRKVIKLHALHVSSSLYFDDALTKLLKSTESCTRYRQLELHTVS